MRITGIALTPPSAAEGNPKATPELLAATLAKYSRSNEGLDKIFEKIDWGQTDKSVDAIFRFIDYGHASIGGLTGGIAIAVDDVSMYLAYKLFHFSQMCDGQESSTRYIKLNAESLPEPEAVGVPEAFAAEWKALMTEGFAHYAAEYERLDKRAAEHPELIKYPAGASDKVKERIRKNYALDRARYFIPFATRTNLALIMSARMWAQTIKQIDALPHPEAKSLASGLRAELKKFAPRLVKHAEADAPSLAQSAQLTKAWQGRIAKEGVPTAHASDKVHVSVERNFPEFFPPLQSLTESVEGKLNRYSFDLAGEALKRIFVRAAWNNVSVAELRDLNRNRTGYRFTPLLPVGFYLPEEIDRQEHEDFLKRWSAFARRMVQSGEAGAAAWPYAMLLGTQITFEHATMADKFAYEVELRTGIGAHYRYAEHLGAAARELFRQIPELETFVKIGTAEPE